MEHSTAIMEDAGAAIEAAVERVAPESAGKSHDSQVPNETSKHDESQHNREDNRQKRKAKFQQNSMQHGSRGRNSDYGNNKRHKKSDMGRGEYFRGQPDKRQKNQDSRDKREAGNGPGYGTQFTQEEIDADEKKPKRKVAVLIGYSGTGYKGMQISPSEKTIEGDLFNAFIAAGAISKANANDPKKVSLVRCARTDKGVHAAGNMISLKLIVDDKDIVKKINDNLTSQIRVWGIERTIGSFSCYQACDSRWYEYLIPSHAFLPPHPSSWIAKRMEEFSGEESVREAYEKRQEEVQGFWAKVEEEYIKPILDTIDDDIRWEVVKALNGEDEANAEAARKGDEVEKVVKLGRSVGGHKASDVANGEKTEDAVIIINEPGAGASVDLEEEVAVSHQLPSDADGKAINPQDAPTSIPPAVSEETDRLLRLRAATKKLRNAYTAAKRRYRIPPQRVDRIQAALDKYVGTMNYHNYTVQKTYNDPSSKRHIRSFVVNPKPILIGEGSDAEKSEWLSLKVHGQSFMMHQIRKMVGMATLMIRCGTDLSRLDESLTSARFSIPKVPGLGLLLERPVFDSYNNFQAAKHDREPLMFSKYETELEAFKEREIYQRIFREEEERNEFAKFFNHVDNFKESHFLYVTGQGLKAVNITGRKREDPEFVKDENESGGESAG